MQLPASKLGAAWRLGAAGGGDECCPGGAKGVVPGLRALWGVPAKPVDEFTSGEPQHPALSDVKAGKREVGELPGGENLMLGENGKLPDACSGLPASVGPDR